MQILTLATSVVALIISIMNWRKSRVIYGIEWEEFSTSTIEAVNQKNKVINDKLKTGNYIVLAVEKNNDSEYTTIVGKVKK
jgi:hypothetical protein